ncbi:MAG: hypothetical protein AB2417_09880 [Clostridiaceae bacterium]
MGLTKLQILRLRREIEDKVNDFLEDNSKSTNKTKSTEFMEVKLKENIRVKSINKLNEMIKERILYMPIDYVDFENEINEFQVVIGIDRGNKISSVYEDSWECGEKITLLLEVKAKLLQSELKYRFEHNYEVVKFGEVKITPVLGERTIPKEKVDDYGLSFPCEAKDAAHVESSQLSESEILDFLYKYHTRLFDDLYKGDTIKGNILFVFVDESKCTDYGDINDDDDSYNHEYNLDNWSREDINEYYGYERDYDGDLD